MQRQAPFDGRSLAVCSRSNRTTRSALLALFVCGLGLCGASGSARAGESWTSPFPGVRVLEKTTADPLAIWVAEIDLCHPGVLLRGTSPAASPARTSVFGAGQGVQVAINGGFYNTANYAAIGLTMGAGQLWEGTADSNSTSFLAAGRENRVQLSLPEEIVARPAPWVRDIVSGIGAVLRDGNAVQEYQVDHYTTRQPRTGLGLSRDGRTLYLAVVDGRSGSSLGVTTQKLGSILKDVGAWQGINLDGGGSSTMWVQGRGVVNRPADGSERTVSNHLGVFAQDAPGQPSLCCTAAPVDGADGVFGDLPTTHWGYASAVALLEAGITSGCQQDPLLFCPECRLKRDQMAALLVRALGDEPLLLAQPTFEDVAAGDWAYGYIERLVQRGITAGCSQAPRLYCPAESVYRSHAAIFLTRALGLAERNPAQPSFTDVPADHPAYRSIETLFAAGIVNGCAENPRRYCPDLAITRVAAAAMIARAFGLLEPGEGEGEEGEGEGAEGEGEGAEGEGEGEEGEGEGEEGEGEGAEGEGEGEEGEGEGEEGEGEGEGAEGEGEGAEGEGAEGEGEGAEGEGNPGWICEPGNYVTCACLEGRLGRQFCAADGMSWKPCECLPEGAEGEGEGEAGEGDSLDDQGAELGCACQTAAGSRVGLGGLLPLLGLLLVRRRA
ncbi:MAG: phosphodiester glycosidase family protein [Myxococcota bacterium]|nr:phosphodiester glycosidase family protein [Myxococcota bacterium]